jgi:hypothetical protein
MCQRLRVLRIPLRRLAEHRQSVGGPVKRQIRAAELVQSGSIPGLLFGCDQKIRECGLGLVLFVEKHVPRVVGRGEVRLQRNGLVQMQERR